MMMRIRTYRTLQALTLAILGFYLLDKFGGDVIQLYINPHFILLTLLVALLFFILAQRILFNGRDEEAEGASGSSFMRSPQAPLGLLVLLIPLALDLAYQALPYQARYLYVAGINQAIPLSPGAASPTLSPTLKSDQYSILDWVQVFNKVQDPRIFNGEAASVVGLVDHPRGVGQNSFYVFQFALTNSVADLQPVGVQVDWPQSASLPENQWVQVAGVIVSPDLSHPATPRIQAQSVRLMPDPDVPYLFP